ncbi:hypothetical protein CWI39_1948p0010, partial [Hamiltosporidium magnivora]
MMLVLLYLLFNKNLIKCAQANEKVDKEVDGMKKRESLSGIRDSEYTEVLDVPESKPVQVSTNQLLMIEEGEKAATGGEIYENPSVFKGKEAVTGLILSENPNEKSGKHPVPTPRSNIVIQTTEALNDVKQDSSEVSDVFLGDDSSPKNSIRIEDNQILVKEGNSSKRGSISIKDEKIEDPENLQTREPKENEVKGGAKIENVGSDETNGAKISKEISEKDSDDIGGVDVVDNNKAKLKKESETDKGLNEEKLFGLVSEEEKEVVSEEEEQEVSEEEEEEREEEEREEEEEQEVLEEEEQEVSEEEEQEVSEE